MVGDFPASPTTWDNQRVNMRSCKLAIRAMLCCVALAACTPIADRDMNATRQQGTENNEFLPTNDELTNCVGLAERPGCGSDSKGGWRMTLAFAVMTGGLVFVGWRIVRGVRSNEIRPPVDDIPSPQP